MPWPVTHILIAEKYYQHRFKHLNHQRFIVGTCYPDIRYPAKIEREQTHLAGLPLCEIVRQTPFKAGLLFHCMVDGAWNHYIREYHQDLFEEIPHTRAMFHTMKILQDLYLYRKLDDWGRIANYFKMMFPEEFQYGASRPMVRRWHGMLVHYLKKPPNIDDLNMLNMSLPPDLVSEISIHFQKYRENPTLKDVMTGFYDQVDTLMQFD